MFVCSTVSSAQRDYSQLKKPQLMTIQLGCCSRQSNVHSASCPRALSTASHFHIMLTSKTVRWCTLSASWKSRDQGTTEWSTFTLKESTAQQLFYSSFVGPLRTLTVLGTWVWRATTCHTSAWTDCSANKSYPGTLMFRTRGWMTSQLTTCWMDY